MNVKLLIEYDGTDFHGWQRQPGKPTIQAEIEDVLEKIHGERTFLYGAGRTDSGVHALGQVANFHSLLPHTPEKWREILNFHLPPTIRILDAEEVPETFHAQKNAQSKIYEYRILNRRVKSALHRRQWFIPSKMDWAKVRSALPMLEGRHDFRSFQGPRPSVKTTVRTIHHAYLVEHGDGCMAIRFQANGFLKQMVRTMVGTLVEIGQGKRELASLHTALEGGNRKLAGATAPPVGLYLCRVIYNP